MNNIDIAKKIKNMSNKEFHKLWRLAMMKAHIKLQEESLSSHEYNEREKIYKQYELIKEKVIT